MKSIPSNPITPHLREWPPHPPLEEPQEDAGKVVAKGLIGGLLGLPWLVKGAVQEVGGWLRCGGRWV